MGGILGTTSETYDVARSFLSACWAGRKRHQTQRNASALSFVAVRFRVPESAAASLHRVPKDVLLRELEKIYEIFTTDFRSSTDVVAASRRRGGAWAGRGGAPTPASDLGAQLCRR